MENKLVSLKSYLRKKKSENEQEIISNTMQSYIRCKVNLYSSPELDETDKHEVTETLKEYTKDYINREAKRLTYNQLCIKQNKVDKIKIAKTAFDYCYAIGFIIVLIFCYL